MWMGARSSIPCSCLTKCHHKDTSSLSECGSLTRSNLVVTWKVMPHMDIISWSPLGLGWFALVWLYFGYSLAMDFLIYAPKKTTYDHSPLNPNKGVFSASRTFTFVPPSMHAVWCGGLNNASIKKSELIEPLEVDMITSMHFVATH